MKRLLLTLCFLLLTAPAWALELHQLTVDATFAPPHNEPVVGDRVARYRLQASADVRMWRFAWEGEKPAS